MYRIVIYLLSAAILLAHPACGSGKNGQTEGARGQKSAHKKHGNKANKHMHKIPFKKLVGYFESPGRAAWQKPDLVMKMMGNLKNAVVADLGAGSGYFTFRLAKKAKKVIALDPGDNFLKYLQDRKTKRNAANVEIRKTPMTSTNLQPGEADVILLVNAYHHINNRVEYFRKLRKKLKKGGMLIIVDFKKGKLPVGPPDDGHKLAGALVEKEIKEAGYSSVKQDRDSLRYQYIVTGR